MPPLNRVIRAGSCAAAVFTLACAHDVVAPERAIGVAVSASNHYDDDDDDEGHASRGVRVVTFEDFALGAIHGQFDWQSTGGQGSGAAPLSFCAVYDHVIADPATLVPTAFRNAFGERSLRISNAVTSGCYADHTFSHRATDVAGERGASSRSKDGLTEYALDGARLRNHLDIEWSIMSARPDAWQPGLELVASPARGDDHRMSWVQVADRVDGLAVVFAERSNPADPGAFARSTIVHGLDRRRAHVIRVSMDFLDGPGNDIARVYVDGVLRHTGASWETYYNYEANGRLNFGGATPAVNRVMFRTGSDTHRGVPGDPAPATLGYGFLIDRVSVAVFSVARSADACRDGGWRDTRDASGRPFRNQGDCVSWVRSARRAR
ncbi:MAG: hypothetical protein Q8K55_16495 [Gemmatimonadaceae bacterium]|nr:hypothetical protein [Gemmatimonadaceae bacterium]